MNTFIGKGELEGKGVYANRNFKQGEIVIQYNLIGPLSKKEFNELSEIEKDYTHSHYGKLFLYMKPERYVNHSEKPNTYQDHVQKADIALRNIEKGEMITTDHSKDDIVGEIKDM